MHAYFEEWKFKHPQPEDMKSTLERVSKKDLSWLFHDLIQTTNHIDYKLSSVKSSELGTVVKVKNKGQVDGPIEINVYKNDQLVETHWVEPGQKKTRVDLTTKDADRVQIDASNDIPEMYRQNNTWMANKTIKKLEPIKLEFLSGYNQGEIS